MQRVSTCLVLLSLLMLPGCKNEQPLRSQGLIYCSEGSPATFNPQLDTSGTTVDATSHQLYDRLLNFDPVSGKVVPGLASSWLISRDGLIYTFQLRKKVQFHHTHYFTPSRNFNADDVMFSMGRWRDPEHPFHPVPNGKYPYFDSLGLGKIITHIKRLNGYRIEIKLTQPDSSFLANLATDFSVILSAEYAAQLAKQGRPELLDKQPIGTGPYQFVSYRKDDFIRYQKNPHYWHTLSRPEQLIYDITPSASLRLAKLMTGECDAIGFPAHSELNIIRDNPRLHLEEQAGLNVGFWAFNTSKPPFDNSKVRRALAMAIDRNSLLEAIYFDSATLASGIIPPSSWAYQQGQSDTPYNPVAARELLNEQGVSLGFKMDIWAMPVERPYNPNATAMAELMQQYLAQVGIEANIVSYEWSTFRRLLSEGRHDSVLIGWSADNGDPDNFYRPLLSCGAIRSGTNRARWCSPEYDSYINQALKYTNEEQRKAFYQQANQVLYEQMPLLPIAHAYRYLAFRNDVTGLRINPFGGIRFAQAERK